MFSYSHEFKTVDCFSERDGIIS